MDMWGYLNKAPGRISAHLQTLTGPPTLTLATGRGDLSDKYLEVCGTEFTLATRPPYPFYLMTPTVAG